VSVPQIAIVGRPNVGKSSLFNWLAGRRIAIVDPAPGVTRDRLAAPINIGDRYLELIDTGGIGVEDIDNLTEEIEKQIAVAIDQAAVILLLEARQQTTGAAPKIQDAGSGRNQLGDAINIQAVLVENAGGPVDFCVPLGGF
jgi:GTP-binding protein